MVCVLLKYLLLKATEESTKEYQERFDQYAEELIRREERELAVLAMYICKLTGVSHTTSYRPLKQPSDDVNVYQDSFEHEFSVSVMIT